MGKEAIEAVLARIDIWLLVFGVIVVGGVAGESFFGIRHWWNSRKLQAVQQAENKSQAAEITRLNNTSEQLKNENLKLQREILTLRAKMADRDINADQREKMLAVLRTRPRGQLHVESLLSAGREALQYAIKIAAVFHDAGWEVNHPQGDCRIYSCDERTDSGKPLTGVILSSGANSKELLDAVESAVLAGEVSPSPVQFSTSTTFSTGTVGILVGSK